MKILMISSVLLALPCSSTDEEQGAAVLTDESPCFPSRPATPSSEDEHKIDFRQQPSTEMPVNEKLPVEIKLLVLQYALNKFEADEISRNESESQWYRLVRSRLNSFNDVWTRFCFKVSWRGHTKRIAIIYDRTVSSRSSDPSWCYSTAGPWVRTDTTARGKVRWQSLDGISLASGWNTVHVEIRSRLQPGTTIAACTYHCEGWIRGWSNPKHMEQYLYDQALGGDETLPPTLHEDQNDRIRPGDTVSVEMKEQKFKFMRNDQQVGPSIPLPDPATYEVTIGVSVCYGSATLL